MNSSFLNLLLHRAMGDHCKTKLRAFPEYEYGLLRIFLFLPESNAKQMIFGLYSPIYDDESYIF